MAVSWVQNPPPLCGVGDERQSVREEGPDPIKLRSVNKRIRRVHERREDVFIHERQGEWMSA